MRTLLYGLIGFVVLAVAGVLLAPGLIDWNRFKRDIADEVKAATGRELAIAGRLDLAIFPTPHLVADDVRLANLPGAAVPDMARIKSLRIDVRVWPLLRGRVEAETVRLVEPVIELERLGDGRVNWDLSPPPAVGAPARGETGMVFAVEKLVIVDGTASYRDQAARQVERAEKVNAELTAASLAGPFRLAGKLVAHGKPVSVDATAGALGGDVPVPITLRVGLSGLTLDINGSLSDTQTKPRFEGKLKGASENLARAIDGAPPKALASKLALTANLKANQDGAALELIEIELGEVRGRGAAKLSFGDRARVEGSLAINRLVLAPWLESQGRATKSDFSLPSGVAGAFDLAIQLVEAEGGPYRDIKVAAALADGQVKVSQASARAPGGGSVSLNGVLAARGGRPDFNGALSMESDYLRGFLDALKLDVAGVPADRLLKLTLKGKLQGGADTIEILDVDARVDDVNVRGGVVIALGARLGIGARLDVDRIALDAYLAPTPQPGKKTSAAAWNSFDANVHARVGTLTHGETEAREVAFDGTLQGGKLKVREVSARDISGAAVKLAGTMTKLDAAPVFDLDRIEATRGAVSVTGTGKIEFGGARPMLTAKLVAGDITFDPIDGPSNSERWPRNKFDLSALDSFDADVTVEGSSVNYRNWHVHVPRVAATLKNRVVEVSELSGRMFDGAFKLGVRFEAAEVPTLAVKLRVDKANIAAALFDSRRDELDLTAGNMDLDADLTARGDNGFALISSLAGTAKIALRDGVVKGFDLPAVSRRLKEVNDPFDLLSLGDLFSGGESKIDSLDGTFQIEDGVIRTNDLAMAAPAGAGLGFGGADIAHWTMYAKAEFHLTELDAPPVVVVFTEALDAPVPTVYDEALRDWVVRRGLGIKEKAPPPKPATPATPPAPTGRDLTRGLLDGLKP